MHALSSPAWVLNSPPSVLPRSVHSRFPCLLNHLHVSTTKNHVLFHPCQVPGTRFARFSPAATSDSFIEDAEDVVVGDCVVFEEGIFDDPFLEENHHQRPRAVETKPRRRQKKTAVVEETLVPEKWKDIQAEINMTKKDKRRIARELEFASRLEKKKKREFDVDQYSAYRSLKLSQLKPLVLDNPDVRENDSDGDDELQAAEIDGYAQVEDFSPSSGRVVPRNPRLDVDGSSFLDIKRSLENSPEDGSKESKGSRKLFTKEEKLLLNRRIPDLADASSSKWIPVHTLAASGQFYLLDMLLKHNVDINAIDKDGLTALHKAILCKKQAVTNYLLRESANPFVRDRDGATLIHYAVLVASVHAIKILILYNVDINLSDNYGWTPLHLAVQARRTDVIRLLLIKGADKSLKNKMIA
ncbi:Ankyrin repeat domain-containing protein [Nymphaea thermarum]|nr:Ankyrin repeat domain-containing protein [Nymphaea thermarum]